MHYEINAEWYGTYMLTLGDQQMKESHNTFHIFFCYRECVCEHMIKSHTLKNVIIPLG